VGRYESKDDNKILAGRDKMGPERQMCKYLWENCSEIEGLKSELKIFKEPL